MTRNRYTYNARNTALHEAAHAVMCILKNVPVSELVVHEKCDDAGRLGYCEHYKTSNFMDRVWIALAGPACDAITQGIMLSEAFMYGGASDFDTAHAELGKLVYPRVPTELVEHVGVDIPSYLDAVDGGCGPDNVRGQLKRKLTLFTKECMKADDFVQDWVHREAAHVVEFLQKKPGVFGCVTYLADRLADVRKMDGLEVIDHVQHYFQSQRDASLFR